MPDNTIHDRRVGKGRADGIHPQALSRILVGRRPGQTDHGVLGSGVSAEEGRAQDPGHRAGVEDHARTRLQHHRDLRLHAVEDPVGVDAQGEVELLVRDFVQGLGPMTAHAGVVESHVQPAIGLDPGSNQRLALSFLADIATQQCHRPGAQRLRRLQPRFVDIPEHQPGAHAAKPFGQPLAKAAASTCDQD